MNKQPEVTAATRKKLTDAFWQLLSEKELNKITIKNITDLAGYNRGTFYQYFTDIYELVESEEDRLLQEIVAMNGPRTLMHEPENMLKKVLPFLSKNADQIAIMLSKNGFSFTQKVKSELYPFFLEQFELEDEQVYQVMFSFMIGGIMNALVELHNSGGRDDIPEMLPVLISMAKNGPLETLIAERMQ